MKSPIANTYAGWLAAIEIMAEHSPARQLTRYPFDAEHDVLYCGEYPQPLTAEEEGEDGEVVCTWRPGEQLAADSLVALGFHWDADVSRWAKFT